jgi:hypothetical protein
MSYRLVVLALTIYALTFLIASSSLLHKTREWVKVKTPWLHVGGYKHFIDCRMCVGFWIALAVCNTDWRLILPAYGLSYFLATQEN